GLLIGHQCASNRSWQESDLTLLDEIAVQLAIAIQQAATHEQLQAELDAHQQTEAALLESEAELRGLFAAMEDVVLVLDRDGRYLKIPSWYSSNLLRPSEELVGTMLRDFFPAEQTEFFLSCIRQALDTGQTQECEYSLLIQGTEQWFNTKCYPLTPETVLWVARNISDRKRAEMQLEIQNQILERIARSEPLPEILAALLGVMELQLDGALCSVMLCDQSGLLHSGPAPQLPESYLQSIDGIPIGEGIGSCGTAAFRREPVIVSDIATDPLWQIGRDLALPHGLKACWSFPIFASDGRVLGTFGVYYRDCRTPQPGELNRIAQAANMAGIAIERQQANQVLEQLNQELERRVEERTLAFQKSEQRYRAVMDFASDAILLADARGNLVEVNQQAAELLGYSREELIHMNVVQIHPPEVLEAVHHHFGGIVLHNRGPSFETLVLRKDGTTVPVDITGSRVELDGEPMAQGIFRDIRDRKQAEAALQRSEELYRTLAKNIPNGVVLLFDRNLRYLIAEGIELATLGLSKELVEGKTLRDTFPPEICDVFEPAYRAALAGETKVFKFPFGSQIYLVYTLPVTDEDREISIGMVMARNITHREQAQKELQRSNALLKAQQEANLDGVLVIDEQGAIASYNRRFWEMWQIPEELMHSGDEKKVLNYVLPSIAQPQQIFQQIEHLDENPNLISRDEIPLHDGRFFERYSAPVLSLDGESYGRIWSFRDITERKQTEHRLRQQAIREQLLAGMNQRIRQSLNLDDVLNTAVAEVRQFLACDRTLIYRFNPDWSGTIVVESVGEEWMPILGMTIEDHCFKKTQAHLYQKGWIRVTPDIYKAELASCHIELLERFQVRANLVVPILQGNQLWGLLIAHQCSGTRQWQDSTVELLRQLSVQLSVAIQQAALFKQLADELTERKAAEAALRQSEAALKAQTIQLETTLQELQQTQLQLVQTEKMSSLGQLVAGVAHEINNPVSFISGNIVHADQYTRDLLELVELYSKHYPQPIPDIEDHYEAIDFDFIRQDFPKLFSSMKMGTHRIRQIVNSLKNFSRLDEAERKQVNIHEGIDNTLLILQHRLRPEASNIKLVKEYGNLPQVECYPGQLNQVFMNLLSNAIDALEKLKVEGSSQINQQLASPCIKIHTAVVDNGWVVIRIADNGPGISEEIKARIFDPFFTTKPVGKGTGLGLSISYQIVVKKHNGQLRCLSEPGKGTEFIVEIPLQPPAIKLPQQRNS
ncbi:MAG: PAS domain S-box protein, partial [Coleofasciculus sp. S288]|nr:PAS domain S-box protein [Coleofasciculus sp. S288]